MTRDEFIPATTLNVLAAAWLQFEVHDWFSHGANDPERPWEVELDDGDPWPERPMRIRRTPRDGTCPAHAPQAWINPDSHWWDASQLYGRDKAFNDMSRAWEDGKLRIDSDGLLPADLEEGLDPLGCPGHELGRPRSPAHGVRARAQRDLRPPPG